MEEGKVKKGNTSPRDTSHERKGFILLFIKLNLVLYMQ